MNIYNYLKKDHSKVSRLFKNIISCRTGKQRQNLFVELKRELELHTEPEHYTLYAALRKNPIGKEEAEHGDKEHTEIKKALGKLSKIPPLETVKWLVQLGELKRMVEHHVEEEENTLFKQAKNSISEEEAQELAIKMEELKEKMMQCKSFKNKFTINNK